VTRRREWKRVLFLGTARFGPNIQVGLGGANKMRLKIIK
jgi:hypothetical protein